MSYGAFGLQYTDRYIKCVLCLPAVPYSFLWSFTAVRRLSGVNNGLWYYFLGYVQNLVVVLFVPSYSIYPDFKTLLFTPPCLKPLYCAGRPGSSEVPRNPLTRWDVSSTPAKASCLWLRYSCFACVERGINILVNYHAHRLIDSSGIS